MQPAGPTAKPVEPATDTPAGGSWFARAVVAVLLVLAVTVVWWTNDYLSRRFSETVRNRSDVRLALYSGNVMSELQRTSIVPLLLARDPALINSLNSADYTSTSQRLISTQAEIGVAGIEVLDTSGRVVAATDRKQIGASHMSSPAFVDAQRSSETTFTVVLRDIGGYEFS